MEDLTMDVPGGPASLNTAAAERPTRHLPVSQLIRLSLYWLGLSSIFAGLHQLINGRILFHGLGPRGSEGTTLFLLTAGGSVVAMLVQPTIGSISDYTISRWGRRKPYIFVGSCLDLVFLWAIATSNALVAIAVFYILLQVSSNFAQGPFQGYVPDLVPASQVGLASALVGLMQVLGNVVGFGIAAIAISLDQFVLGTVALGVVEFVTMLGVVLRVDDGRAAKSRAGRSWLDVAREAWGADVLQERSFLWLVGSRFFVLMGGGIVVQLAQNYLHQSHGLSQDQTGSTFLIILAIVTVANVVSVVPAARASDRVGRKRVIYLSCLLGGVGLAIVALAPTLPIAYLGMAFFGVSSGTFLAVDWALMTDIIPKASSGRYMGISNVATASAGVIAIAFGGRLTDIVNQLVGVGAGPRAADLLGVACFVVGAILLRPVAEGRNEGPPLPPDGGRGVLVGAESIRTRTMRPPDVLRGPHFVLRRLASEEGFEPSIP
jgi:MFS family permease